MSLRVIVLGAAAGGGLPQWNCNGPNSRQFWTSTSHQHSLIPATQSSIALSIDGINWALLNTSPDLRSQIIATPALQPRDWQEYGLRDTPIRSVLITNGDVDHLSGLLTLREKQAFNLYTTKEIQRIITDNPIFQVLDPEFVTHNLLELDKPFALLEGLKATLFAVPGKVPLFLEDVSEEIKTDLIGEQTVGVEVILQGKRFYYIPGCAHMPDDLAQRLDGADFVMFDGTLWHDQEMMEQGVGHKTGARMGHMSMSGENGSLEAFADLNVKRKVYIHINNTNPVWIPESPEREEAEKRGWEISFDGMEITL